MFSTHMSDDFTHQGIGIQDGESMTESLALQHIKHQIGLHRRTLKEFGLPEPLAVHGILQRDRFDPIEEGRKISTLQNYENLTNRGDLNC